MEEERGEGRGPGAGGEAGGPGPEPEPEPGPRDGTHRAAVWYLQRVGAERRGERLGLNPGTEVTVGRGFEVTYRLLARTCPLMISRNHCTFHLTSEGQCSVIDNQSLNGVWVNGERIESQAPRPLREGDLIQLGVPLEGRERAEYQYRLTRSEQRQKVPPPTAEVPGVGSGTRNAEGGTVKRKHGCEEAEHGVSEGTACSKTKIQRVRERPTAGTSRARPTAGTSRERAASPPKPVSGRPRTVSRARGHSAQELPVLWEKSQQVQELTAKARGLEGVQEEQEATQAELGLQEPKEHLCPEQECQQQQLESSFHEDQQHLEHRELEAALSRQRKELEDIIRAKDMELEETKGQTVKAQRDGAIAQITDVLENELQCIICSEHFIEAVTLNCSHSFCSHCILEWRKRKEECPICRQTIQSQTRSVVLDSCIERMLDSLSQAVRQRRVQLVKERKALKMGAVRVTDSESSSCDEPVSTHSTSTVGSLDIEERSDHGETEEEEEDEEEDEEEEGPVYYIV